MLPSSVHGRPHLRVQLRLQRQVLSSNALKAPQQVALLLQERQLVILHLLRMS